MAEVEKRTRRTTVALLLAVLLAPLSASGGVPETVVGSEASPCPVRLEAAREEGVLALRTTCAPSPEDVTRGLSEAFEELRTRGRSPSRYRLLFIGRLVDYPWFSEGLARWAANSLTWDTLKGRPRSEKNVNRYVATALQESGLLAPFADALGRERLRIEGVSLEKVLILPLQDLPFGTALRGEGFSARARVPFDALVHLRLAGEDAPAGMGH